MERSGFAEGPYYTAKGCSHCAGTGYAGRIPIYEIMVVSPSMEQAIESGLPASRLREIAVSEGMVELAVGGLQQAQLGNTSIEEVYYKLSS